MGEVIGSILQGLRFRFLQLLSRGKSAMQYFGVRFLIVLAVRDL